MFYQSIDATVGFLMSSVDITEGELLQVCLELSNIPSDGLQCDITVSLSAMPYSSDGKQGEYIIRVGAYI